MKNNLDYKNKAILIAAFANSSINDPKYDDFFEYNDVGVPLAELINLGLVEKISKDGELRLEETYRNLCDVYGKNYDDYFENFDELKA